MLKLGITRLADLRHPRRWLGRDRHASLLLLDALAAAGLDDPAAHDLLVARVRMPNGTWRQTARGRLARVDDLVVRVLRAARPAAGRLAVLDVGASTGVTSVELYEALHPWFALDFVATDLTRDVFAVRAPHGRWTIVLDERGGVVQHLIGPFVLPGQLTESPAYPVNRLLKRLSTRLFVPGARRMLTDVGPRAVPPAQPVVRAGWTVRRIPFVALRCARLAAEARGFRFEVADVLRPLGYRVDLVRAMNVITPENLDPDALRLAVGHCVAAVRPGGFLVTGQSTGLAPDAVRATLYRVDDGRALPVVRLGDGCPVEAMVAA